MESSLLVRCHARPGSTPSAFGAGQFGGFFPALDWAHLRSISFMRSSARPGSVPFVNEMTRFENLSPVLDFFHSGSPLPTHFFARLESALFVLSCTRVSFSLLSLNLADSDSLPAFRNLVQMSTFLSVGGSVVVAWLLLMRITLSSGWCDKTGLRACCGCFGSQHDRTTTQLNETEHSEVTHKRFFNHYVLDLTMVLSVWIDAAFTFLQVDNSSLWHFISVECDISAVVTMFTFFSCPALMARNSAHILTVSVRLLCQYCWFLNEAPPRVRF